MRKEKRVALTRKIFPFLKTILIILVLSLEL